MGCFAPPPEHGSQGGNPAQHHMDAHVHNRLQDSGPGQNISHFNYEITWRSGAGSQLLRTGLCRFSLIALVQMPGNRTSLFWDLPKKELSVPVGVRETTQRFFCVTRLVDVGDVNSGQPNFIA